MSKHGLVVFRATGESKTGGRAGGFVLFGDERYDLKKGETRWITLEGEAMYGRRLLV